MKKIALEINAFDASISQIENLNLDKLSELSKKIIMANNCLQQFRNCVKHKGFITKKEEIKFFKYQKPYIQGRLESYRKQKDFFLLKPKGNFKKQRKYINKELNSIDSDNCKHLDFIKYYRFEKKDLDHLFFLRGNYQFEFFLENSHHYDDPDFSTRHDYIVSRIITNDLLVEFYKRQLQLLKGEKLNESLVIEKPEILSDLDWTETKTALIELIIALNESFGINNGKIELNRIKMIMEYIFDIDLGNIHKVFEQIRARENDPTKFIDSLKEGLLRKINSK